MEPSSDTPQFESEAAFRGRRRGTGHTVGLDDDVVQIDLPQSGKIGQELRFYKEKSANL